MAKETGWVILATEGATVDGRTISKEWINQMAANYDPELYQARIWPEHFRSSWAPFEGKAWGDVLQLKAAEQGGKLRLFGKLRANDYLIAANKDDQKLYLSIEPEPDFQMSGKCYLMGLAVTDSPASTGTSRLKFSIGNNTHEHEYSALETLSKSDFINSDEPDEKSLFALLHNFFSRKPSAPEPTEEQPMNKEQFDALMGKVDGISAKVGELEGKIAEFSKKPADDKPADKPADTVTDKPDEKQETGITAEQFSKLESAITGLVGKVDGMETKFNALSKEVPNQQPAPTGSEFAAVV